jgi:pimeloyl-ACP methyl ester carboxylesterase
LRLRTAALAVLALGVVACGPPVNVKRVDPRTVSRELARSALNSDEPSLFSENVLYRWALTERFKKDPEGALATLHERYLADQGSRSALFALSELCFLHADDSGKREYYLASAVYGYAFLFPGDAEPPLDELDPRARIAADLYNRGLTEAFASTNGHLVDLRSGTYPLPFGQQLAVYLDEASLTWANRRLVRFVPVAELKVSGLGSRYRRAGIGAPLAADTRPLDQDEAEKDYLGKAIRLPVTALLRIDDPSAQLGKPMIQSTLRVYSDYESRTVDIDDRNMVLEAEPSAALAYSLSKSQVWGWELWGFLLGDLLGQQVKTPLAFVEPYRPGRIPVVFVHGTASSPGRWANMLNVLSNTRPLHDRYQYWFFFYETGNPMPYSAMRLREVLTEAVRRLDPQGTDAALQQMVVIGHSQGGLLTKMTAIDSGDQLWNMISRRPLDQLHVSTETHDLLQRSLFVKPLPFVREVIFISTPHRGSYVAGWSISRWVSRFVRLPRNVLGATAELLKGNRDDILFDPERPAIGAVYGMTPGSPFIKALAPIPISPQVKAHSIIPVTGDLPPDGQGDGVVKYESAHIGGVESELVVPRQSHSTQDNPLAIEEVRRILLEHADAVCETSHVACGDNPPPRSEAVQPPAPRSRGRSGGVRRSGSGTVPRGRLRTP